MQNTTPFFQRGSWSLDKSPEPSTDLVDLLARTVWGTPGKTLYQHLDTRQRITQLQQPHYICLRRREQISAGMTLCQRATQEGTGTANALYVRYLSFVEKLRNKELAGKQLSPDGNFVVHPKSFIKNRLFDLFNRPEVVAPPLPGTSRSFYYAFVESENQRSLQICSAFGFQKVRSFQTIPFSRFFPKKSEAVSKVTEVDKETVREAVLAQYRDFRLFFTDHLFAGDHYYIIKKQGEIAAGIRAMPVNWAIKHLPGLSGKLTINLVPHLPLLSRLFNPKNFRFVAFESMFYRPGCEQELFTLMEGVLAELELYSGLIWLDDQCDLFPFFLNSGQLGLLHRLETPSPVNVLIRFSDPAPGVVDAYRRAPAYISALDVT